MLCFILKPKIIHFYLLSFVATRSTTLGGNFPDNVFSSLFMRHIIDFEISFSDVSCVVFYSPTLHSIVGIY